MYTCSKNIGGNLCKTSCNVKCGKCDKGLCKSHELRCDRCYEPKCQGCYHKNKLECEAAYKKRERQERADKIRLHLENLDRKKRAKQAKADKIRLQFENLDSKIDKITELLEAIVYAPNGIKYNEALKDFEERVEKSE